MVSTEIGDLYAIPLPGGFGACQVTGGGPVVCLLDWHGTEPPTTDAVAEADAMRLTHHGRPGTAACCVHVTGPAPHSLYHIGNAPVGGGRPTSTDSHAGWEYLIRHLLMQRRWDHVLPVAAKEQYLSRHSTWPVIVDLGAGPATVPAGTDPLDLTGSHEIRVPEKGPVSWRDLGEMKSTSIVWAGDDRGFGAALAELPLVDEVSWRDPPEEVDLSGSTVTTVLLGPGVRRLRLPATTTSCAFTDGSAPETVSALDDGHWLSLHLTGREPVVPAGLGDVREISIETGGTVSVAGLAGLAALTSLTVRWHSGPGRLDDAGAITGVTRLHLIDGYAVTARTLPPMPSLQHLEIDGIARLEAAELKAAFGATVTIRGAKNETWLLANPDNPFRDWADADERGGQAACRAYAAALRGVTRDPAAALHTFVTAMNQIDSRYRMIDTPRREEVADAFFELAEGAAIGSADAREWFDDWRDF